MITTLRRALLGAAVAGFACMASPSPAAAAAAEGSLKIVSIDVEGGAATLYVTPEGRSFLFDTGWAAGAGPALPPGSPPPGPTLSSAERIVAAVKAAGLTKLDYLGISHYHVDHMGGFHDLIARLQVDAFVDHGPNRQPTSPTATPAQIATSAESMYARYEAAIAGKRRIIMKPGDTLSLGDLTFTAVTSDRQQIAAPLPGAGAPGARCAEATVKGADTSEDAFSLGLVAQWGQARILALADTPWNVETRLVCPTNLIGKVDLMIADNHGNDAANAPLLLENVRPTAVLVNNGPTKGADGPALERLSAIASGAVWQLHYATRSPDKNAPPAQIANLEGPEDAMHTLTVLVSKAGDVTFVNPRTGGSKTYPRAR